MRTINALLFMSFILSCEASPDVSYVATPLLTASGIRPSVVLDNHDVLNELSKRKLDGTLVATDSGRQMLTVLVACALASQDSLIVGGIEFFGEAGLAPEWAIRDLREDSKGWISACVLAHLSREGLPVAISMRGSKGALHPTKDESTGWPVEEGAFFGNLFTTGPIKWFACRGKDPIPTNIDRSCATQDPNHLGLTLCGLTFVGDCSDVCRWSNRVCRIVGVPFREVITVKLQQ